VRTAARRSLPRDIASWYSGNTSPEVSRPRKLRTFAFKADLGGVRKRVDAELSAKGCKVAKDDPHGFGRKWRSVEYKCGSNLVIIFENMQYMVPRHKCGYSVVGEDIDGWVSFQVRLRRAATQSGKALMFDRH
jgi:hypothetical protein